MQTVGRIRDNGKTIEWMDMESSIIQMAKLRTKDIGYRINSTAQEGCTTKFLRIKCQAKA